MINLNNTCILFNNDDVPINAKPTTSKSYGNIKSESKKQPTTSRKTGAVAANSELAAKAGLEILKRGGSAADAAIATLLTEGLANPHSMGVGGGFLLTYYDKATGKAEILNAREFASENATCKMFANNDKFYGGLSVGTPGELKGYAELHRKYGNLPWNTILEPVIDYCNNGIPVSKYFAGMLCMMKKKIQKSPSLKCIFINEDTGDTYQENDMLKRRQLGITFQKIADKGVDVLYNGELTAEFVQDIQAEGGIITKTDLNAYRPTWMDPETQTLPNNLEAYSTPAPGSGCVLFFILNVIFGMPQDDNLKKWFWLVEAWKYAFGFRCQLDGPTRESLSNDNNIKEHRNCADPIRSKILQSTRTSTDVAWYTDKCFSPYFGGGTCHICILAPNGDAVSVTSSINSAFGAIFASPSTGIILNNHMMDFNHSKRSIFKCNQIKPNKQPLSCMTPTIIVNKPTGDVRLIIGCAGGSKIITSTSQVILDTLFYNLPLSQAIARKRLHHQLAPMMLFYEAGFEGIENLEQKGHVIQALDSQIVQDIFVPASSSVTAISVENGKVEACGDPRRDGVAFVLS